jgi:hypothetical protein
VESIASRVLRRVVAHEVRVLLDRDATLKARQQFPAHPEAVIATFDASFALYRIFDGEELVRVIRTGKITGGMYSVKAERAHGASWGENISALISWGNRDRGRRLGNELFLAKLDAMDKRFFHLDPKVNIDPEGPNEQPASMNVSTCNAGLGCSIMDVALDEVTLFIVDKEGQMRSVSEADAKKYVEERPKKDVELREVSRVFHQGHILGFDVAVVLDQSHPPPTREQGPYYGTWRVETKDGKIVLQGAASMEDAVKRAQEILSGGHIPPTLDLLPKAKMNAWKKRQPPAYKQAERIVLSAQGQGVVVTATIELDDENENWLSEKEAVTPITARVLRRFVANYFKPGDVVLYGKYKNKRGKIVAFGQDKWGNPTIEVEPIPKGRKQNKVFGMYKVWRADVKENVLKQQAEEAAAALKQAGDDHDFDDDDEDDE